MNDPLILFKNKSEQTTTNKFFLNAFAKETNLIAFAYTGDKTWLIHNTIRKKSSRKFQESISVSIASLYHYYRGKTETVEQNVSTLLNFSFFSLLFSAQPDAPTFRIGKVSSHQVQIHVSPPEKQEGPLPTTGYRALIWPKFGGAWENATIIDFENGTAPQLWYLHKNEVIKIKN